MNHTRKQWFASVLIDSEVRILSTHTMTDFRIGTLKTQFLQKYLT
jgi:hypothetical protein